MKLPIDEQLPSILDALEHKPNLVLVAEPGAGKTTRLPPALLRAPFRRDEQVLVLEPRRLAARMAAKRIATELGEKLGERIGFAVRFERALSERTRVVFLTEALLTRRFLEDPSLDRVSCVILDEFHERSLHTDLALALLRKLQRERRPELRIVVMSATLDAERLASFLEAELVRVPGRTHPVQITHLERPDDRPLDAQVRGAVRSLCVKGLDGDVLVFLPGAAEIRRAETACAELARDFDLEIAMLHGDLPAEQQDHAVSKGPKRKIILSTNIAETSLTLEGVVAVVDSGLARVAGHSPWSGLSTLNTQKISQASAIQRAGRAGRVRPGECLRLYTKADFESRARFDAPELVRSDLASTLLTLAELLGPDLTLDWFEPPPDAARAHALDLLRRLGALSDAGAVTALGRELLRLPVHPRLGRLAHALAERGYAEEGATIAALLGERDVRSGQRTSFGVRPRSHDMVGESDLLARLEALESAGGASSNEQLRRHELEPNAVRAVLRTRDQLSAPLRRVQRRVDEPFEKALSIAALLSYSDRVGRRRSPNSAELVLSGGGSATLSEASVVKEAEFVVAIEAEQRPRGGTQVHTASAIEPEWLLEYFDTRVRSERSVRFQQETQRIECSEAMYYDGLVLDETRRAAAPSDETARALAAAALAAGMNAPWNVEEVDRLRRRIAFAATQDPNLEPLDDARLEAVLREHCLDKASFEDLRRDPLEQALFRHFEGAVRARIEQLAPVRVRLPSGRDLTVHYELDRPPWVESRLQDFFGSLDGPRLGDGRTPLVLHLLAPNQRPVQVTTDLRGFWDRHYPSIRKELMRRYPRHSWPEDPRTAEPPAPRKR